MKCPRCSREITAHEPRCTGCGFHIADLDALAAAPPPRRGLLNDFAGVIEPAWAGKLQTALETFRADAARVLPGAEMVIVTQKTTAPLTPQQYVFWLFNHWHIGDLRADENRGLMLLLALDERRVESEVGYGLEPFVSDRLTGEVLDHVIVPLLKEGGYGEAFHFGVKLLADIVLEGLRAMKTKAGKGKGGDKS
jgi:uncharacterized protein